MNLRTFVALGLACILAFSATTVNAGDKEKMADNKEKKEDKGGSSQTFTGALAVKPKDAAKDVVCCIVAKKKGEKDAVLKLEATGELAKQIEEIRQKGVGAKVTGVLSDDTIKVSKIEEYVKMKK